MLVQEILKDEIRKINDGEWSGHEGWPSNDLEVADRWSNAFYNYANMVTPISSTSTQARDAFRATMLSGVTWSGVFRLEKAFFDGVVILASGMLPLWTATTPMQSSLQFEPVSILGFSGGSAYDCAELMSQLSHNWMKTGIATNTLTGVTINWL